MNQPITSQASAIARELEKAFAELTMPRSVEISTLSPDDADEIIKHIYRYTDDVQNFYIPRLLTLAICADVAASRRNEWIRRLVELLNVDFEENVPGADTPLKDVRRETFSSYSRAQSAAIHHWLEFVQNNFDYAGFKSEIDCAVEYWRNRA